MELIILIGKLEAKLNRELVGTINGDTVSYTADTTKTVTVNGTDYYEVNRACLVGNSTGTFLYLASYGYKKLSKINISTINSITIG